MVLSRVSVSRSFGSPVVIQGTDSVLLNVTTIVYFISCLHRSSWVLKEDDKHEIVMRKGKKVKDAYLWRSIAWWKSRVLLMMSLKSWEVLISIVSWYLPGHHHFSNVSAILLWRTFLVSTLRVLHAEYTVLTGDWIDSLDLSPFDSCILCYHICSVVDVSRMFFQSRQYL